MVGCGPPATIMALGNFFLTNSIIFLETKNFTVLMVMPIKSGLYSAMVDRTSLYIGSFISGILAVTVGILQAPILGLWVLILYLVIYQIEAYFITPMVIGKVVGLNPIVIILALLIGGKLGGVLGMVLAVPLAAVFAELLRDMIKKRKQAE